MYFFIKKMGIVCFISFLCLSCTPGRTGFPALRQAASLMEQRPDSAFTLLKSMSAMVGMGEEERARYALLLAEAADKSGYSLLPCDSLLNIALHHYDEGAKEKAIVWLYKGKVHQEMENYSEALKSYRMALEILSDYPEEYYLKGFVYNLLGGLYGKQNLYEQAKNMYVKACYNDSLAHHNHHFISSLSNLGVAYIGYGKIDSALIYQQRALRMSLNTDSFLLHTIYGNFGDLCARIGRKRSAITCLKQAYEACREHEARLQCLWNLGEFYHNDQQPDSALFYLYQSKEAKNIHIRYLSYFDLYAIAKQKGDNEDALKYLEISTQLEDSIYSSNVATELEKNTYKWNADSQVRKEQFKAKRRIYTIVSVALILLLVTIIIYQQILKNKKIEQSNYKYLLLKLKHNLTDMQQNIARHEAVIADLKEKQESSAGEIEEKEREIEEMKLEKEQLRTWLFRQSALFAKIEKLSAQQKHNKERITVLTNTEQKQLHTIIWQIYADYIDQLSEQYPKLNEDDILLLCLQLADLSPFAIALCFGNSDTQVVAQRKYRMKSKME